MWWLLIPGILITILVLLFVSPFSVEIDSENAFIRIRYTSLADGGLSIKDQSLIAFYRVAWWRREIELFPNPSRLQSAHVNEKAVERKKRRKKGFKIRSDKLYALIHSFRVKYCRIRIDTGDMPANGILFPWVFMLGSATGKDIAISFIGENECRLKIENTMARMVWVYFRK